MLVVAGKETVEIVGTFGGIFDAIWTINAGVEVESVADENAENEVVDTEFDEEEKKTNAGGKLVSLLPLIYFRWNRGIVAKWKLFKNDWVIAAGTGGSLLLTLWLTNRSYLRDTISVFTDIAMKGGPRDACGVWFFDQVSEDIFNILSIFHI